jgi:hypothetical protein
MEEARKAFEELAQEDFSVIRADANMLVDLANLTEVASYLGDVERAARLYELLRPHREQLVLVGPGVASHGSASRFLGVLAATLRRWDEAEGHFIHALAENARIGARPAVAHTQRHCAEMLLARRGPGDSTKAVELLTEAFRTSEELGMKRLADAVIALKPEVESLAAT